MGNELKDKKCKVGILTFHGSHNYGAMLQAYALQKTCDALGAETSIINYRTDEMIDTYRVTPRIHSIKQLFKNILTIPRMKVLNEQYRKFESFIKEYMKITERYNSEEALMSNPPQFDVYISGSDQVWNASKTMKDIYFFPFQTNGKKISYAASSGDGDINPQYYEKIKTYLDDFTGISTREKKLASQLAKICDKDIKVNCDPIFLLSQSDWKSLLEADRLNCDEPYIFCYFIGEIGKAQEIIDAIKSELNIKTITVSDTFNTPVRCDKSCYNAGPIDFLRLLQNANMVLTNSFHGTAFSIEFRKPFFAIQRETCNTRIQELLETFNLNNRLITASKDIKEILVDYSNTDVVQESLVKSAKGYLRREIGT